MCLIIFLCNLFIECDLKNIIYDFIEIAFIKRISKLKIYIMKSI